MSGCPAPSVGQLVPTCAGGPSSVATGNEEQARPPEPTPCCADAGQGLRGQVRGARPREVVWPRGTEPGGVRAASLCALRI